MSELQIGVLILGGSVIGLVYAFNMLQEWRFRKKMRKAFMSPQGDVLLNVPKNHVRDGVRADRLEPVLLDTSIPVLEEPVIPSEAEPCAAHEPSVDVVCDSEVLHSGSGQTSAEAFVTPALAVEGVLLKEETLVVEESLNVDVLDQQALVGALLDPSLDFIAEVVFHHAIELDALPRFHVSKRVEMIGRSEKGVWLSADVLLPRVRYNQINIGLQLVDRAGAVSEQELSSFCQQVAQFAEGYDAAVSFPLRQQKLVAARELDRFCAEVDVLIGINIVMDVAVTGGQLQRYVESAGLCLGPDGAFHYLADSGNTLYSLVAADQRPFSQATLMGDFSALTVLFDVPRVAGRIEVFERVIAFARQLASEFDAELVDDNRRVLTDIGLGKIREQLRRIYTSMDNRGIAPGSIAALRLFA